MKDHRDDRYDASHIRQTEPEEVRRAREFLVRKLGGPAAVHGRSGPAGRRSHSRGAGHKGREERWEARHGGREAQWASDLDHGCRSGVPESASYDDFLTKLKKLVARKRVAFRSQLSVFVGVNGFLFVLNMMGSGPFYPWFLFPAGAMGIGLLASYHALRHNRRILREAEQLGPMSDTAAEEFRELKKFELRSRSRQLNLLSVGSYVAMINIITSPSVPWALVPVGIMSALYMSGRASSRLKLQEKRERFELAHHGGLSSGAGGYEDEAQAAADAIISRLEKLADVQQLPEESEQILNTYLEQVKILSAQAREIDLILREIPRDELAADREKLEAKIGSALSDQLRKEYRQSLEEIDQHEQAYRELEEQREVIGLRIRSAINNLKKLRLDVARINSIAQIGSLTNFGEIKRQSRELSDYIHDLADGYREAEEAMGSGKGGQDE